MSRQNPIVSIEKAILAGGSWFFYKMGQFTTSGEETVEKTGFPRFLYDSTIGLLQTLIKVPKLVIEMFKNIVIFIYILCVLVVIGQFDWVLNDLYGLMAMSMVLTYITYR